MTPRDKKPNAVKLTLYVDEAVIIKAKQEAIGRKTSLSDMVETLLRQELDLPREAPLLSAAERPASYK